MVERISTLNEIWKMFVESQIAILIVENARLISRSDKTEILIKWYYLTTYWTFPFKKKKKEIVSLVALLQVEQSITSNNEKFQVTRLPIAVESRWRPIWTKLYVKSYTMFPIEVVAIVEINRGPKRAKN